MLHFCECSVSFNKVKLANTENSHVYFTLDREKKDTV